ncbi:MAG TPA: hypothetical protein VEZ47_02135, partial [Gemmatirosa sp.]|nr:hypothetical protein [Gemmatirosa sp.]
MIRDDPAERTAGEPRRHDAAPPTSEAPAAPASLTTFVVDDEALARRQIADLVAQVPWARHAGEAADGAAGLAAIDVLRPDVLFLDVQMP